MKPTFRQCSSTVKKCLYFGGEYSLSAVPCLKRQQKVNNKKSLKSQHKSLDDAANATRFLSATQSGTKDSDYIAKAIMCITISTIKNAEVPEPFESTLSYLLHINDLPYVSLGDISLPSISGLLQSSGYNSVISSDANDFQNVSYTDSAGQDDAHSDDLYNNDPPQNILKEVCSDNYYSTTYIVLYNKKKNSTKVYIIMFWNSPQRQVSSFMVLKKVSKSIFNYSLHLTKMSLQLILLLQK